MCKLIDVKTNFNMEVRVADNKKEFVENIIDIARYCENILQIYDVICVNGLEELNRNRDKTQLYNDVMNRGKTIYMKEKQL